MQTGETGQLFLTALIPAVVVHNIEYGTVTIQAQLLVVCGARATGRTLSSVIQIPAQVWRDCIFSIISRIKVSWCLMQEQRN